MSKTKIITIDGPSGVGKGTLALALADYFGFALLDSGALYRLVALDTLNNNIDLNDESAIAKLALALPVVFNQQQDGVAINLKGQVVTELIRTEKVASIASKVAAMPKVRDALLKKQQNFAVGVGLVADGRDLGVKVFKNADFKLFLTANSTERAKRRVKQLQNKGDTVSMSAVKQEIELRDERDKNRKCSPLMPSDDAIILDTSCLDFHQVLQKTLSMIAKIEVFK